MKESSSWGVVLEPLAPTSGADAGAAAAKERGPSRQSRSSVPRMNSHRRSSRVSEDKLFRSGDPFGGAPHGEACHSVVAFEHSGPESDLEASRIGGPVAARQQNHPESHPDIIADRRSRGQCCDGGYRVRRRLLVMMLPRLVIEPVGLLRYSINVTLDGCCDHRAIVPDES